MNNVKVALIAGGLGVMIGAVVFHGTPTRPKTLRLANTGCPAPTAALTSGKQVVRSKQEPTAVMTLAPTQQASVGQDRVTPHIAPTPNSPEQKATLAHIADAPDCSEFRSAAGLIGDGSQPAAKQADAVKDNARAAGCWQSQAQKALEQQELTSGAIASDSTGRTLSDIEAQIAKHAGFLQHLSQIEAQTHPTLEKGFVALGFVIQPDGQMTECHVAATNIPDPDFGNSVAAFVQKIPFGISKSGPVVQTYYPIRFLFNAASH